MPIMNNCTLNIAAVTVNWERPQDTIECVNSILACGLSENQVVIVDNGSMDDSVDRFRENFPNVDVIKLQKNFGFAAGYNVGIQKALNKGASRVLIINNDAIIDTNSIQAMLESPWDVAIPKILYYEEPNRIWSAGCQWRKFPPCVTHIGRGQLDTQAFNIAYTLDYASGCAMMIKREVFENSGGFDPIFESYYEDYDFCYRVRQAGYIIGFVPQSRVFHKGSQTIGKYTSRRWQLNGRNAVIFYRKDNRFSWQSLWICVGVMSMVEIIRGHIEILPDFFTGVKEGLQLVKHRTF